MFSRYHCTRRRYLLGNMRTIKRKILCGFGVTLLVLVFASFDVMVNENRIITQLFGQVTVDREFLNWNSVTQNMSELGRCKLVTAPQRTPVDLRIIVITYNRPNSTLRLLDSISKAHFEGDSILLEVWIDKSRNGNVSHETLATLGNFRFSSGECHIHVHKEHVGITGQWLHTWNPPRETPELAVIFEDDLTVSPYFYKYLKLVDRKYGHSPNVSGYSLQGKSIRHSSLVSDCCLEVDTKYPVFLYPTLGTSGFAPNRLPWIKFQDWLAEVKKNNQSVPFVPKHKATRWYKSFIATNKADSMWEMEYLYYTWKNQQYTVYPNFQDHRGLTFNWYEDGLHSTGKGRGKTEEQRNLVLEWTLDDQSLPSEPAYVDNRGVVIKTEVRKTET
ncbi:uncharacterized protein LOC127861846 isoform X7 [Dreissena polymorpha]|uniref:uncharacterized protein LOC127861846 isoform X7 n=1 Tax=Dreissena polymorpha TaxID=45954 RepID=UPI002264C017|nr:uncharacterized protein LOC127861846 isoform X7 [Dreissena polymorpha]